jgi:hypothetical protein
MPESIGFSTLSVIPSAKGFGAALSKQVNPQMGTAGTAGGKAYGSGILTAVKGFAAPVAGAFAGIKIIGLFKDSIQGASALSESASKVGVVFGSAGAQIMEASKTSATAMGISKAAYLENTSTLGNLLVSLKIAPKEAATMSQSMVALAADMASLNNTSIEEAFQALRSGLTGETEPLKRFGVNMNETTLKTQALAMGLIQTTKDALDPQTKALAAQGLIMAQTGTAQGDFARTSEGLANQQRIAAAQTEDLKTKLGQGLLPITVTITTTFNKFITGIMEGTGVGGKFKDVVVRIFNAVKPFVSFLINNKDKVALFVGTVGGGILIFKGITAAIKGASAAAAIYRGVMTAVMLANGGVALSSGLVVGGLVAIRTAFFSIPIVGWIAAAVTGLVLLYIKFESVRNIVTSVLNEIINWFQGVANVGKGMINVLIKAWNLIPWHKDIKLLADVELPHLTSAAEKAAAALNKASHAHPSRGPIKGSGKPGAGGGGAVTPGAGAGAGGGGAADSSKLLDALNLKMAIENQKKTLGDFTRYLSKDFISSIKDSGAKASDVVGKLVSGVDGLAKGFAATITDPKKQGIFNLASTKIVNALETKLLGFQSAFDAIQTAREKLKTKIADADSALKDTIKLRGEAAGAISDLLAKPFGQPSELVKALSGAEATGESIISGYNSMVKMVTDRFASIKGDKKDSLLTYLKASTLQLLGLAKERDDVAKDLELAQTKLESAVKAKGDYADSLASGLKSATNSLTEFVDKEGIASSPAGIIEGFKARLSTIKNFSDNLKALATRGLNQNLLDQIIGMGAVDGGALATSLATAGDDQIAALNATGVEISAVADSLGATLSSQFYDQSISQAQGIVKGWQDSQAGINATMRAITSGIGAELAPLIDTTTSLGEDAALALLNGFKSQDNALIAQATSLGARMAQAVADALTSLRAVSGGADFGVADAKAASAKLAAAKAAADKAAAEKASRQTTDQFAAAQLAALKDISAKIVAQAKQNQTMSRASGHGLVDA